MIGLHATKAAAIIDINVILPDTTWHVILDLTTIRGTVTITKTGGRSVQVQCMAVTLFLLLTRQPLSLPTQQEGGQYMSRVWLKFRFCCSLDNYPNNCHFHLNRRGPE
ncbi:hypothetical protein DPMN_020566 [Dreissena polymorpha]|uniref:Uncharacterized protein n=1 Tax=Dreissena polymorpha TaxID=45954 RepID=A0A9D4MPP5_DREPO|nr:hypothetical protein DPMN_002943 [Dreissena polymorpha]KAH3896389.1 hypothetical protein DPMN_020566 [Dreissena polymorpha]